MEEENKKGLGNTATIIALLLLTLFLVVFIIFSTFMLRWEIFVSSIMPAL